jgi:hypothetical protein
MPRPRKNEPSPDTTLVAFRLSRALLGAIDKHGKQISGTRSDAARDLLQRGLRSSNTTRRFQTHPAPQPAPSLATVKGRALDAIRRARSGLTTARLADVREMLRDLPRESVNRALLALDREGHVQLGRAVDLAALTNQDRIDGLEDPVRGLLIYASLPLDTLGAAGAVQIAT